MEALGNFYTPRKVAEKLNTGLLPSQDHFIEDSEQEHFSNKLKDERRIKSGLPPGGKLYRGPWYDQGDESTCAVWAVANGTLVVGAGSCPAFLSSLLNRCLYRDRPSVTGLYDTEILSESTEHRSLPFQLSMLDIDHQLISSPGHKKRIEMNANTIRACLEAERALLVTLRTKDYLGRQGRWHKVCISGYKVSQAGLVNVQVIDSNLGIVWTSIEHLTASLQNNSTLTVAKVG